MTGYEKMEKLAKMMGKEYLYEDLMIALSDDELKEGAEWIAKYYGVERIFEENN